MSTLTQLIYTSVETEQVSIAELESILFVSRKNNTEADITGMLLYREGSFIQVLEGPKSAVEDTYSIIQKDKRHRNVSKLYESNIAHRDFPNWAMAFNGFEADAIEGMSDFLHPFRSKDEVTISNGSAKLLLKRFREINKR